jgi:predicted porin
MPRDYLNLYGNLYWMQDDASAYLISSSVQRWNPDVTFDLLDESNYKIDSYVFNLGGDWDINEKLNLSASYTYTRSKGDVASGTAYNQLVAATGTVDAVIDNTLHSFAVGSDYLLGERSTIKLNYIYDRYTDDAYDLLSGGVHTLALGLAYALQ